jgi:hypothetical protein
MKILIYSEGRVGSHSLGGWLSKELSLPFIPESTEFDYETNDNFIKKIYFSPKNKINFECFDKVIRLYRQNTFEQSISLLKLTTTQLFRHTENKFNSYYEIDREFCDNNYRGIFEINKTLISNNTELKNLEIGLILSYEQIFLENVGQKLIEEYIGFKSKTDIYDLRHKLRIETKEIDLYLLELIENYKNSIKLI